MAKEAAEIYERSPTRVDLAGGTLDCWPLYLLLKDPVVVNVAIDVFTHCWLKPRLDQQIKFVSDDLKAEKTYDSIDSALRDSEPAFALARAQTSYFRPRQGFELRTKSESPVGGGLGGSSSLCISMIKAFSRWLGRPLETHKAALVASHIEAQMLRKPTGTQDYFPSLLSGLCLISYGVEGPKAQRLSLPKAEFADRFVLIYTGQSHNSGINNWQVIKSALDGDPKPWNALEKLEGVAREMREVFALNKDFARLPALFEREYAARTELSDGFSSLEIRRLQELARKHGAVAKICGAGGGGCVMIWCPDQQAAAVRSACVSEGFRAIAANPWEASV